MRACTAVVTELSWNDSNDEKRRYRAIIEFIEPEDWAKELNFIYNELLDATGELSKDIYSPDSEAAIAYAKIKAVYPKMTKEDVASSSVAKLLRDQGVDVLGTVVNIEEAHPEAFYKRLQHFVDSKEKETANKQVKDKDGKAKGRKPPRQMEFWPLIKVVKQSGQDIHQIGCAVNRRGPC